MGVVQEGWEVGMAELAPVEWGWGGDRGEGGRGAELSRENSQLLKCSGVVQ